MTPEKKKLSFDEEMKEVDRDMRNQGLGTTMSRAIKHGEIQDRMFRFMKVASQIKVNADKNFGVWQYHPSEPEKPFDQSVEVVKFGNQYVSSESITELMMEAENYGLKIGIMMIGGPSIVFLDKETT